METKDGHAYSIRNIEDGQTVSLIGDGQFCIGLTLDEKVSCSNQHRSSSKSSSRKVDNGSIAVPLILLTVWKTSGVTVSPASRDLKCKLNGEDIGLEAHCEPGSQIEVGDKVFQLIEGTSVKPIRRTLPPTPGLPILPTPPPKPQRSNIRPVSANYDGGQDVLKEWCLTQLPQSEQELLQQVKDPNQLASLASSYLTRHINIHTDVVMSAELTDNIFQVMQEVAHHRRDILRRFLSEVMAKVSDEEKVIQDHTLHVQVTSLLVEILQQFLDPSSLVIVSLQLLRALSHIPGNVPTMVASNSPAAVLGSMAVYKDDDKIQNYCLDILAKLATFLPIALEKPPLRESCIDLVTMALTLHFKNLTIVQAGIRTLANLASSLHSLAFSSMKDPPSPNRLAYVTLVMSVLEYLYSKALPLVQDALAVFHTDLTAKTDSRRFLFEYAKMDQLKSQFKLWSLHVMEDVAVADNSIQEDNQQLQTEQDSTDCLTSEKNMQIDENGASGILKKSRSFEKLHNPQRRVSFVDELNQPLSLSSSSAGSSPPSSPLETSSSGIQVLSVSRIIPATLSLGDSTDTETVMYPHDSMDTETALYPEDSMDTETAQSKLSQREQETTQIKLEYEPNGTSFTQMNNQTDGAAETDEAFAEVKGGTSTSNQTSQSPPSSSDGLCFNVPVDLTNFRYSAADIIYMKRLMALQIASHVCSASIQQLDMPILKLIELPLNKLLSRPGIPKALWQFAVSQFEEGVSLVEVNPCTVIGIIDALRYKMLTFDLIKNSLLGLIENLSPKIHARMFEVTCEVLESVFTDAALSPVTTDPEFVSRLEHELENVRRIVSDPHPVGPLIDGFKILVRSRLKQQ